MVVVVWRWGGEDLLLERELAEIDVVFWGGDEIQQLADFSLERSLHRPCHQHSSVRISKKDIAYLEEELKEVNVRRFLTEVFLEEVVNGSFEHERIVDGDKVHSLGAVPARLATTGDARVHKVVRD